MPQVSKRGTQEGPTEAHLDHAREIEPHLAPLPSHHGRKIHHQVLAREPSADLLIRIDITFIVHTGRGAWAGALVANRRRRVVGNNEAAIIGG
mmetsp:Transcript_41986/g.119164  ORF Transcript_41986/g.119164 Transcript_41986/m.119164 type:complete len:93 (+) Transcript_41986:1881-2159(+)